MSDETNDKKDGFVVRDRRFWASPEEESEPPPPEATPDRKAIDVETLRAAMAELENTKIRMRRDAERQMELLRSSVLEVLLPVLDDLERSVSSAESSRNVDALLQGVKLVSGQFLRTLTTFGLERVSTVGERFDPRVHDAVAVVPVEDAAQDGLVVGEFQPAYFMGDRVVRPAKVQVGRAADRPSV